MLAAFAGSVVVVRLEEESPAALELCWVEVVGAAEVPLAESLTAQHRAASVREGTTGRMAVLVGNVVVLQGLP